MSESSRSPYDLDRSGSAPGPQRIAMDRLREFCGMLLQRAGLSGDAAALVADSLVDTEARGISSHGVQRTRIYAERIAGGMIDAAAAPERTGETAATIFIDAHNAIGQVGARAGTEAAMVRAAAEGAGFVGVRNSNHCGALAYFARRVATEGYAVIAASNAPATMAYFGGRTRAVGTNPLCLAVPRADGPPIVVDMATSATARGRIILANQVGETIPDGWAIDKDGRPTTDAAAALEGSVLPFSGAKGSGLAMMIDLLCGALLGGPTGERIGDMYEDWARPQQVGHFFIALDATSWAGADAFATAVTEFASGVHDLPPAAGFDRVLLPGELEDLALARSKQAGVVISGTTFADLNRLADEFGAAERLAGDVV